MNKLLQEYEITVLELEKEWKKPKKKNGGYRDDDRITFLREKKNKLLAELAQQSL
ncbi:MAG: hypothetical protein NW226_05790 [Microscillaceae bacterium]|nr:hypothetical protein [Microscillaceae bacterium]